MEFPLLRPCILKFKSEMYTVYCARVPPQKHSSSNIVWFTLFSTHSTVRLLIKYKSSSQNKQGYVQSAAAPDIRSLCLADVWRRRAKRLQNAALSWKPFIVSHCKKKCQFRIKSHVDSGSGPVSDQTVVGFNPLNATAYVYMQILTPIRRNAWMNVWISRS